jgi:hypothetical protein
VKALFNGVRARVAIVRGTAEQTIDGDTVEYVVLLLLLLLLMLLLFFHFFCVVDDDSL